MCLTDLRSFFSKNTVKPAQAITSIKQSPVLKDHFFFVPKVTS